MTWTIHKYRKAGGRCPIDDWEASNALSTVDRARMDARLTALHRVESFPPEAVKKYGDKVYEVKIKGDKKQLRPLAHKDGANKRLILLSGAIEKGGKIPKGDVTTAENLLDAFNKGHGSVEDYFPDESDVEKA